MKTFTALKVRKAPRSISTHPLRITFHHLQVCPHHWCKICFIDDQQIGSSNPRSTFTWNFISSSNINYIDEQVHKLSTEAGSKIVTTTLH